MLAWLLLASRVADRSVARTLLFLGLAHRAAVPASGKAAASHPMLMLGSGLFGSVAPSCCSDSLVLGSSESKTTMDPS